tara:strand:- start:14580 stop:16202 length:1623 start_codon:yes stop_codon:yes gene_type:complete
LKKSYKQILIKSKTWPIVKLAINKKKFLNDVSESSIKNILKKLSNKNLFEELETTVYKEKLRIKKNPWRADPPDEEDFWKKIQSELIDFEQIPSDLKIEKEKEILEKIVTRYANEISSNFKSTHYKFARRLIVTFFARLLNTARLRNPFGNLDLDSKINILGKKNQLRELAKIGTIVMVPTHFSHLDSALIGWAISYLGLPPFMYGAGMVLFNMSIFSYFMDSLGAYKVDRRKKHLIYLETLKTYSRESLVKGCHSLFYPGGTRSRSGSINENLKLGLLSSAFEAQKIIDKKKSSSKKIFIVPITFNYQFVLEAPALINQYLVSKGQEKFYLDNLGYSNSYKIFKFLIKFFTKGSNISLSIGNPLDVYGNYVNKHGDSIDSNNKKIISKISINKDIKDSLKDLSSKIYNEFHKGTQVFPSNIIAFTLFETICKKFKKLDFFTILRLSQEDLFIDIKKFKKSYKMMINEILILNSKNKIKIFNDLKNDIDIQIESGLENLGMYHAEKPVFIKNDKIHVRNMKLLYYYRNRLKGFGFRKIIK